MIQANLRKLYRLTALVLLAMVWSMPGGTSQAQFVRNGAVGGVKVDVNGVISNPDAGDFRQLQAAWQAGLAPVPADLDAAVDLRFVSLRTLEAEAARALDAGKPLPESVRSMAGLQRIRYVLIYPEQKDIVLAGPAEGWKVNAQGSVVGKASGRPTLALDALGV